jgi:hypothetical protein
MRWVMRSLVALVVAWALFLMSPYVAFYRLAKAVEAKDVAVLTERVNFRAVRISLSRQIASAYAKVTGIVNTQAGSPVGQVAVSAGTAVVDSLIAPYATPEAIIDFLTRGPSGIGSSADAASPAPSPEGGLQAPELSLERLKDLFFASESRGFRGYVFSFPLQQPPEERFRLVFRLSGPSHGFMWRLVGVELPARVRDQLVQQLARQEASALPR